VFVVAAMMSSSSYGANHQVMAVSQHTFAASLLRGGRQHGTVMSGVRKNYHFLVALTKIRYRIQLLKLGFNVKIWWR
jgi:hypothetical protein